MAKDIATKFTVEGESELKNALKGIDGELKVLRSEMAVAASALKNQKDSMEALTAKGEVLTRQYEQQAQKVQLMRSAQEAATKASGEAAKKAEEYRRNLAETEAALKELASSTEATKEEQEKLRSEMEKHAKKLEESERVQQNAAKAADEWGKSANYAEAALNRLSGEIADNNRQIDKLGSASEDAEESLREISEAAKDTGEAVDEMGSQTSVALDAMAGALAAAGVQQAFEEIRARIEECSAASTAFNKGTAETFTLLPGLSGKMKAQMSEDLLSLKADMAIVGKDGTDALYQAVSAGVSVGKSMAFMETAQKAAVGGVSTLTTAVDGLTSVTNAYGSENVNAQQAADLMFTAVKLGKTNFEQLSGTLYNVTPIAANNKIAFEDITAAIAAMTAQGIPTAQSTTQLRQLLVELTDSGSEVAKTFEGIAGVSFKQFVAQGGNTQQALQKLYEKAQNTGVGINELFSSVEAGGAAMALSGKNAQRFATNIDAMKTSVGACNTAYDEMSGIADFAAKKMEAAAETLKIAIGSAMEPQLKALSEAGAGAFQWAADFVNENPWVVAAMEALAVAAGVSAATLAGFAVVEKIVLPAIHAMNTAMAASPWGIAAIAIGTLVAAIGTLAAAWPQSADAAREAADAAETSAQRLQSVAEETRNSADAAEGTAEVCKKYAARLRELEAAGLNTTAAQKEYADIVAELSGLMPELNLEFDEQTGLLKENSKTLMGNIETLKDRAKAAAYMDQYTSALEEEAKAEMALEEFRRESGKQLDELIEKRERFAQLEEMRASGDVSGLSTQEIEALNSEWQALNDTLAQYSYEGAVLEETQNTLNDTVGAAKEAVSDAGQAYDEYNQKVVESGEAQEIAASYFEGIDGEIASAAESLAQLGVQFEAAKESIAGTLDSLFGVFNNVKVETDATAQDLLANLDSQIAYMNNYEANLKTVMEKSGESINQDLVAKLSDGSMESAKILQTMVGASETEIRALNEKFGEVSKGKDKFTSEVGQIAVDFDTRMAEIEGRLQTMVAQVNQSQKAAQNAGYTVDAIVSTVRSRMSEVFAAYAALGEQANAGYKSTLKIQSPSKEFMAHTDYTIEGIELSAKAGEARVRRANQKLAEAGLEGYRSASDVPVLPQNAGANYPVMDFQKSLGGVMESYYRGLETVRQSQVNNYSSRKNTYTYGDTYIVEGITYDDGSNVSKAIKDIVRAARVERRK